jgi:hypothetical protein
MKPHRWVNDEECFGAPGLDYCGDCGAVAAYQAPYDGECGACPACGGTGVIRNGLADQFACDLCAADSQQPEVAQGR